MFRFSIQLVLVFMVAVTLVPMKAEAVFVFEKKKELPKRRHPMNQLVASIPKETSLKSTGDSNIRILGSGKSGPVNSFGKDLPLDQSLHMILPADWTYKVIGDDPNIALKTVSWKNTGTWASTLKSFSQQTPAKFVVDHGKKEVLVFAGEPGKAQPQKAEKKTTKQRSSSPPPHSVPAPTPMPQKKQQAYRDRPVEVKETPMAAPPVKKPLTPAGRWVLKPGSLRQQFITWAKDGGWQLVWDGDDYLVEAESRISGSFIDAITKVINAFRHSGANIAATVHKGNKTILVAGEK